MRITILSVGQRLPDWINQGVAEYHKRFPAELKVSLKEIPAGKRTKSSSTEKALKQECSRIIEAIPERDQIIVLDERGRKRNTRDLAENMANWLQEGENISFIIGGADGLHSELKEKARELWSLSDLTLPHGLARVLLMEQLYRAWTVINRHPYHRE
ncbi:MAG: 23S rRNA (pseudouridine(1915)-N(3))-methyltransferase RlmH [Gammaproteobacteria bacterium]|nr:23S rRNA (pseudouridine(1915)-N(3))-methyltransferase RlmH [Gammaproteobacteria bacterium]